MATGRFPGLGVTLKVRQFQTYTRQLQQVQRVTQAASGATVEAARANQQHVAALNQLAEGYETSVEAARLDRDMTQSVIAMQQQAREFAKANAEELIRIRAIEGEGAKETQARAREALAQTKLEQRAKIDDFREDQARIRQELSDLRVRAAESRQTSREVVRHRKDETLAARETEAANRQLSASYAILGAAMLAVGIPMIALTQNMISQAAEAERLTTAADTAARARGYTTEAMEQEREEFDKLYISTRRANRTIQALAIAGLDATKASELTAVALDLSTGSFLTQEQAIESVTQAVTSGTTVRLKDLNVVQDQGRIHEWYATDVLGKEREELTATEEKMAIMEYLFRIGGGVAGAFASQIDKASGQLFKFNFYIERIRETFGKYLLPVFNQILERVIALIQWFENLSPPVQKLISYGVALSGIVLTLAGAFVLLKPAIGAVATAIGTLTKGAVAAVTGKAALGGLLGTILALPLPLKIAAAAIAALAAAIITNFGGLRDLWNRTFGAFFTSLRDAISDSIPWIIASMSLLVDAITYPLKELDKWIRTLTGNLAKDGWGFEFDAERFFVGAASVMGGFAAGLITGFNQYVLPAVIGIVNAIADFLGGSLPKKGPLAHIEKSGIEIIQAWSQGMRSVALDDLRSMAEEVAENLQQALYLIQDTLYDIQTEALQLDKALYPFEDALFLARAAADLVIIPLDQQRRQLERQLEELEKIAKVERERAEQYLRTLEKQRDAMQEIIDADEERVEAIDHEIFMEEQRLKIMGLTTSTRLLQLRGEKRGAEDTLKTNRASLDATEDQISAEEERLENLVTTAEAQIEALQAQIDVIDKNIELEEERVRLAEEALRIEEARQAQARLALLEETRYWEEQQREAQHYMNILGRIPAEVKEKAEEVKKGLEGLFVFPKLPAIEPKIDTEKIGLGLEAMKQKLLDAFMTPINAALADTRKLLDEELGPAWGRLGTNVTSTLREIEAALVPLVVNIKNGLEEARVSFILVTTEIGNQWRWTVAVVSAEFNNFVTRLKVQWIGWRDFYAVILGSMAPLWQVFVNQLVGIWQLGIAQLQMAARGFPQWWSEVAIPWIQQRWADLSAFITTLWASISAWAVRQWEGIVAFFSLTPEEMGRAIARVIMNIANALSDFVGLAIGAFAVVLRAAGQLVLDIAMGAIRYIAANWQEIVTTIITILLNLEEIFDAVLWAIFRGAYNILVNFIGPFLYGFIDELTGGLISKAIAFGESVLKWISDLLFGGSPSIIPYLVQFAAEALTTWATWFLDMTTELVNTLADWLAKFNAWLFVDMPLFWINAGKEFLAQLVILFGKIAQWFTDTGIPEMVQHGKDTLSSMVGAAAQWIEDNWSKIKDIGKGFLDGIRKGIKDNWDDFKDWALGKLDDILGGALSLFGIRSPAKAFVPVGEGIVLGIRDGFESEWDDWVGRSLERSMEQAESMGQSLVQSFAEGAQGEWFRFETWFLDSVRELSEEVRFEIAGMTSTVSMNMPSPIPAVNHISNQTSYNINASYANQQSEASIRDDLRMMMALR